MQDLFVSAAHSWLSRLDWMGLINWTYSVGWTGIVDWLAIQSLYSGLVFLSVWLVLKVTRLRDPLIRQALWSLVFIRLLLPVDLASPVSLRTILPSAGFPSTGAVISAAAPNISGTVQRSPLDGLQHGQSNELRARGHDNMFVTTKADHDISSNSLTEAGAASLNAAIQRKVRLEHAAPAVRLGLSGADPQLPVINGAAAKSDFGQSAHTASPASSTVANSLLFWPWCLGAASTAALFYTRRRHFARLAAAAAPAPASLQDNARQWARALGVTQRVHVRCTACETPYTIGTLRPVIVLPKTGKPTGPGDNDATSQAQLYAVIGHEMAHIARRDDLWIQIEALFQIVFFFLPWVWWAGRALDDVREERTDALALNHWNEGPQAYFRNLLEAVLSGRASSENQRFSVFAAPLGQPVTLAQASGGKAAFEARIRSAAQGRAPKVMRIGGLLGAGVFACLVLPMAQAQRALGPMAQAQRALDAPASDAPEQARQVQSSAVPPAPVAPDPEPEPDMTQSLALELKRFEMDAQRLEVEARHQEIEADRQRLIAQREQAAAAREAARDAAEADRFAAAQATEAAKAARKAVGKAAPDRKIGRDVDRHIERYEYVDEDGTRHVVIKTYGGAGFELGGQPAQPQPPQPPQVSGQPPQPPQPGLPDQPSLPDQPDPGMGTHTLVITSADDERALQEASEFANNRAEIYANLYASQSNANPNAGANDPQSVDPQLSDADMVAIEVANMGLGNDFDGDAALDVTDARADNVADKIAREMSEIEREALEDVLETLQEALEEVRYETISPYDYEEELRDARRQALRNVREAREDLADDLDDAKYDIDRLQEELVEADAEQDPRQVRRIKRALRSLDRQKRGYETALERMPTPEEIERRVGNQFNDASLQKTMQSARETAIRGLEASIETLSAKLNALK